MSGQNEITFYPIHDAESRRWQLDPSNPISPYYGFIGNRRALDKVIRIDFETLGRYNHLCSDLNLAVIGEAGCGKNELVKRHARANKLPFVEISPKSIKRVQDIFVEIDRVCSAWKDSEGRKLDLQLVEYVGDYDYLIPPVNVFIDEVHALAAPVVQGLLKATEFKDAMLVTEKNIRVNCKNVHWIIATTDRGKLFDAFDTRFTKVILNLYTKDEVAQIIQGENKDWDLTTCKLVAHFCGRVPREALAFAREMRLEHNMNSNLSWKDVAYKIANDNEIDPFGMTFKRLAIIKALGQGPIGKANLPVIAGVKVEELEKFIMPWLLATTSDQESMVGVDTRGYHITKAGIAELDKRNISHLTVEDLAA
jgi:hypothetical protein